MRLAPRIKTQLDSMPTDLDTMLRKVRRLEIEEKALVKENHDEKRLEEVRKELAQLRTDSAAMKAKWEAEKESTKKAVTLREKIEAAKMRMERAERDYNLTEAAEIKYGELPKLEEELKKAMEVEKEGNSLISESVNADEIAAIVAEWTGIPVKKLVESDKERLLKLPEILHHRVVGSGRGGRERRQCDSPLARWNTGSQAPDGHIPIPRADGRRKDRTCEDSKRGAFQQRGKYGKNRHVRVHGKTFGGKALFYRR